MTLNEILSNLCEYHELHPDYDKSFVKSKTGCYCDNCFYGRSVLALELLKYINK